MKTTKERLINPETNELIIIKTPIKVVNNFAKFSIVIFKKLIVLFKKCFSLLTKAFSSFSTALSILLIFS